MHAADELVLRITQGCIAMVSLPVLVAVLQEAACLLEKKPKTFITWIPPTQRGRFSL